MKYKYLVIDTDYPDLQEDLDCYGKESWDLVGVIPMQEIKQGIGLNMMQPNIRVFLKLIFKKLIPDA